MVKPKPYKPHPKLNGYIKSLGTFRHPLYELGLKRLMLIKTALPGERLSHCDIDNNKEARRAARERFMRFVSRGEKSYSIAHLLHVARGDALAGPELADRIEHATGGVVTAKELRPKVRL